MIFNFSHMLTLEMEVSFQKYHSLKCSFSKRLIIVKMYPMNTFSYNIFTQLSERTVYVFKMILSLIDDKVFYKMLV